MGSIEAKSLFGERHQGFCNEQVQKHHFGQHGGQQRPSRGAAARGAKGRVGVRHCPSQVPRRLGAVPRRSQPTIYELSSLAF